MVSDRIWLRPVAFWDNLPKLPLLVLYFQTVCGRRQFMSMVVLQSEQLMSPTNTSAEFANGLFSEQLTTAVKSLPEREQLVLAMVYLEGLNIAEAALVLDTVPSEIVHLHASAIANVRTGVFISC